ncbi:Preprotein translocase subunit Sec61beta [Natronoarchaeum philippinense]|uniref:Preprotein translocase subunit SecG n=1 Tax=Natronoarchaeum philippinense TaxID=558529 RepID=A0A285NQT9_NATPI|nr:preprotein translocase subunit Sec61beta [Natronoarchaeum philippinense]SNZ11872.1 Preprotein translocase subunit Sec61beta [Natronoarchaeum philippinense]
MSSGQNSGGLMSSAGLVRYFDNEDRNAIKMDPKTVVVFAVLLGIAVQAMSVALYGIQV